MNSKEWRKLGWKVYFKDAKVYLFNPKNFTTYCTKNNGGLWMNYDDLNTLPWRNITNDIVGTKLEINFKAIAFSCYCGDGGVNTCDFCGHHRCVPQWVVDLVSGVPMVAYAAFGTNGCWKVEICYDWEFERLRKEIIPTTSNPNLQLEKFFILKPETLLYNAQFRLFDVMTKRYGINPKRFTWKGDNQPAS